MDTVAQLAPKGGFLDLSAAVAGVGLQSSLTARGELGWRPNANSSLFAFTQAEAQFGQPLSWQAGLGFKMTW